MKPHCLPAIALFFLTLGLGVSLPFLAPPRAAADDTGETADTNEAEFLQSNTRAKQLRDTVRSGFLANFSSADPGRQAEVDAFLQFLDQEHYYALTQTRRVQWLSDHRDHPLVPLLIELEGLQYPPRGLRENPVTANLAFAAYATKFDTSTKVSEVVPNTRAFWQQFFGQAAKEHQYEGTEVNDYQAYQAKLAQAVNPLEVEPPAEIRGMFDNPEGKVDFMLKHDALNKTLYALGFPRNPNEILPPDTSPSFEFQPQNRDRALWQDHEINILQVAWGMAYPASWWGSVFRQRLAVVNSIQTSHELGFMTDLYTSHDPETGQAQFEFNGQKIAGTAALILATDGLGRLVGALRPLANDASQAFINRAAALVSRGKASATFAQDVEAGFASLQARVGKFLNQNLFFIKKPSADYGAYEATDSLLAQIRALGDANPQLKEWADNFVNQYQQLFITSANRGANTRVLRTFLARLSGEKDTAQLTAILKSTSGAVSAEEDAAFLQELSSPALDEQWVRDAIRDVRSAIHKAYINVPGEIPELAAFDDLVLAARTMPTKEIATVAADTVARGTIWGAAEKALDAPIIKKFDQFRAKVLGDMKSFNLLRFDIEAGPNLELYFKSSRNPGPFTSWDPVVLYDPAELAEFRPVMEGDLARAGLTLKANQTDPEVLSRWIQLKYREFLETPEGAALKEYYKGIEKIYVDNAPDVKEPTYLDVTAINASSGKVMKAMYDRITLGQDKVRLSYQPIVLNRSGEASSVLTLQDGWLKAVEEAKSWLKSKVLRLCKGATCGIKSANLLDPFLPRRPNLDDLQSSVNSRWEIVYPLLRHLLEGYSFNPEERAVILESWRKSYARERLDASDNSYLELIQNTLTEARSNGALGDLDRSKIRNFLAQLAVDLSRSSVQELMTSPNVIRPVLEGNTVVRLQVLSLPQWELAKTAESLGKGQELERLLGEDFSIELPRLVNQDGQPALQTEKISLLDFASMGIFQPDQFQNQFGFSFSEIIKSNSRATSTVIDYDLEMNILDNQVASFIKEAKDQGWILSDEVEGQLFAYARRAYLSGRRTWESFGIDISGWTSVYSVDTLGPLGTVNIHLPSMFSDLLVNGSGISLKKARDLARVTVDEVSKMVGDPRLSSYMTSDRVANIRRSLESLQFVDGLGSKRWLFLEDRRGQCARLAAYFCPTADGLVSHSAQQVEINSYEANFFGLTTAPSEIEIRLTIRHEFFHVFQEKGYGPFIEGLTEWSNVETSNNYYFAVLDRAYSKNVDVFTQLRALLTKAHGGDRGRAGQDILQMNFISADGRRQYFNDLIENLLPPDAPRPWRDSDQEAFDWFSNLMKKQTTTQDDLSMSKDSPELDQWFKAATDALDKSQSAAPTLGGQQFAFAHP